MKIQSINPAFMGQNNSLSLSNKKDKMSVSNLPKYQIGAMDALSFKGRDIVPNQDFECRKIMNEQEKFKGVDAQAIMTQIVDDFRTSGSKPEILRSILDAKMISAASITSEAKNTQDFISTISGKNINIQKGLINMLSWQDNYGNQNGYALFETLMVSDTKDYMLRSIGALQKSLEEKNVPQINRGQMIGNMYFKTLDSEEKENLFFTFWANYLSADDDFNNLSEWLNPIKR